MLLHVVVLDAVDVLHVSFEISPVLPEEYSATELTRKLRLVIPLGLIFVGVFSVIFLGVFTEELLFTVRAGKLQVRWLNLVHMQHCLFLIGVVNILLMLL